MLVHEVREDLGIQTPVAVRIRPSKSKLLLYVRGIQTPESRP